MQHLRKLGLALVIISVGFALIPYIAFQAESINWRMFAGVYEDEPSLIGDADAAQPGSDVAFNGYNLPRNATLNLSVNGMPLGTLMTDGNGSLRFVLRTSATNIGTYQIVLSGAGARTSTILILDPSAPLIDASGNGSPQIDLPSDLQSLSQVFLPLVLR